jgi:hypothetical protein
MRYCIDVAEATVVPSSSPASSPSAASRSDQNRPPIASNGTPEISEHFYSSLVVTTIMLSLRTYSYGKWLTDGRGLQVFALCRILGTTCTNCLMPRPRP